YRPVSVIGNLESDISILTGGDDSAPSGAAVPDDVGDCLSKCPAEDVVQWRWHLQSVGWQVRGDAGRLEGSASVDELRSHGCLPEAGHRLTDLAEGLSSQALDFGDLPTRPWGICRQQPTGQLALGPDDGEALAQQVMQVASESKSLGHNGQTGQFFAGCGEL